MRSLTLLYGGEVGMVEGVPSSESVVIDRSTRGAVKVGGILLLRIILVGCGTSLAERPMGDRLKERSSHTRADTTEEVV